MRHVITSLALLLLLASLFLTGCGTVTSTASVPQLSQAAATAIGERYFNSCNEANELGQCALLYPYRSLDEKSLDSTSLPFVKMVTQHNEPDGSLEQPDSRILVLTKEGSRYAVDTFGRGTHGGVATSAGEAAERVSWRVATVYVEPTSFVQRNDSAIMRGVLHLKPTPLYSALRIQNLASAEKMDRNQGRKVVLHFKYDFDGVTGIMRWQIAVGGPWLATA
jgi:hypothetical protein